MRWGALVLRLLESTSAAAAAACARVAGNISGRGAAPHLARAADCQARHYHFKAGKSLQSDTRQGTRKARAPHLAQAADGQAGHQQLVVQELALLRVWTVNERRVYNQADCRLLTCVCWGDILG